MMIIRTRFIHLYRAIAFIALAFTQTVFTDIPDLNQPLSAVLAVDENLRMGTLDNGLRYYIRKNSRPEKQAVVQLCVNTGSLNEHDHEQGIAHYLEHTVFKGSPRFPDKKDLDLYMSSHGLATGADTNAYTGFDRTCYFLVIPTTDQELFTTAFTTFGDFAGRVFLRNDDIETERSIILDEIQMRNSVQERSTKLLFKTLAYGTSYPNRFPGGTTEVIANVPADTIRNFYSTWYTPNNMAVVAVGDFDPDLVLKRIKEQLGTQPSVNKTASTEHIKIELKPQYGASIFFVDPEIRKSSLSIYFNLGEFKVDTVRDLRTVLTSSMAAAILNQRMTAHYYQPDAHTQGMNSGYIPNFLKDNALSIVETDFKEGKIVEATAELIALTKQFADHGIHDSEFAWVQKSIHSSNEQAIASANTLPHGYFKSMYEEHFIDQTYLSLTAVTARATLESSLLETISIEDVNEAATTLFNFNNAIYFFSFDDKTYAALGGKTCENELRSLISDQIITNAHARQTPAQVKDLAMSDQVMTGEIVTDIPSINAKKIVLANGVTVFYKWTDFTENTLYISGFAAGGIDTFQDNPIACKLAPSAVNDMGFGGIKPYQWTTLLSDKPGLNTSSAIGAHSRGFSAGCRKEDVLFCLNLLMAGMLQPNNDPELFSVFIQNTKQDIRDKQNSTGALFNERTSEIVCNHPTLFKPITEKQVDAVSIDDVIKFYNLAFNNVSEYTMAISGNITLEDLIPMLNKTIACAPQDTARSWAAQPIEIGFPDGTSRVEFDKKSQQQTQTIVTFPCCIEISLEQERISGLYRTTLNERIYNVLRLDNSKSYGARANIFSYNDLFIGKKDYSGRLMISFTCDKEQIDKTTDLLIAVMHAVQADGFTADEINRAKAVAQNQTVQAFKNNGTWNAYMINCYVRNNEVFDSVDTLTELIAKTTVDQVNAFAQNLVNPDHYFAHSLVSEN